MTSRKGCRLPWGPPIRTSGIQQAVSWAVNAAGAHQRHVGEPSQRLLQPTTRIGGQVQKMPVGVDDDGVQEGLFCGRRGRHAGKDTNPDLRP